MRPLALALVVSLSASASGQTLELLGPSGMVPPEGFPLAVRAVGPDGKSAPLPDAQVRATGAELTAGPPVPPLKTYLVVPRPGAREVVVSASHRGRSAEARFLLGPPAAKVELGLEPAAPVKQQDKKARLSVRLLRADGAPDADSAPPVLKANVGTITELQRVGPGEYTAGYLLPATRHPEVAIIVALSAWPHPQSIHGAVGAVRVPMSSAIDLPGKTEPHADFSIEISGQRWGPVRAGPDGRFRLPVVVPPGHAFGIGTAVDRIGNRRRGRMDLMVPETDQLSCVVNPSRLKADGVSAARVLCATSDPFGKAATAGKVEFQVRRGSLGPPRLLENGMVERIYTAPRALTGEPDVITASWRQGRRTSREELKIELTQGPAEKAVLKSADELVHRGGKLPVEVKVTDGLGRPRPGAQVEVSSSLGGTFAPFVEKPSEPGTLRSAWAPPEQGAPTRARLSVRAFGPVGADPARIVTWARGGALFAAVTDIADLPVPKQVLRVGGRDLTTGEDGSVKLGPLADGRVEVRHKQWPGLQSTVYVLDGGSVVFPAGRPIEAQVDEVEVAVGPGIPVNVRIQVSGSVVTYWAESVEGELLPDRTLAVTLSAGSHGAPSRRNGRTEIVVSADRPVTVSVADRATGVTALAEVRP